MWKHTKVSCRDEWVRLFSNFRLIFLRFSKNAIYSGYNVRNSNCVEKKILVDVD